MCLPSDALLQHLPSYLGFSYLGRGVSLHGCSSKEQPLLLTLDEGQVWRMATSCILPQPHTTQLLSNHHEGKLLDFRDLFPFGEPSFTVRSQKLLTAVTFLAHWIQKEIYHFTNQRGGGMG